uniref:Serine/threonine-protein phosphatase 2A regulatory subunit B'' subunit gamma n=1 Tax=Plectus sambesii TaxID=2011161 RepID=A0A914VDD5_9BILA
MAGEQQPFVTTLSEKELRELKEQLKQWQKSEQNAPDEGERRPVLPRFYDPPPADDDAGSDLRQKLREEARSRFLHRKSKELLENNELKEIWALLETHHTTPVLDNEKMIGYEDFKKVATKVPEKARQFFSATVFGKLQQRDPYGRVPIVTVFNYAMRKTWLRQSRIGLSLYDINGQGYLTEKDLDLYITELIPTMPQLAKLEESFHSFYTCTAVRRFLFFLDPKRIGRVRIVDILASGFLDDLLELRDSPPDDADASARGSAKNLEDNWFSAENALRVYGQYLNLDTDRNGMLSRVELKEYGTGMLTDTFVERVFQECLTYDGEMDYKGYLDFVLAMENKKDRSALEYFFRILDVRQRGYLDAFAINFFFRSIQKQLAAEEQQMVLFEDMKDEIFDMVKPRDPLCIRLADLIECKQGDTVVSVLTDLDGFWKYENREYLAQEPDNANDSGPEEVTC